MHWERTGRDTSFTTAQSTWRRGHWHTQAASVVVQTQDQSSQITRRLGALLKPIPEQIHPIILHFKGMVPLFEFSFFTHSQKHLPVFLSMWKICMIHPARTGILQIKTWIKSNTIESILKVWRDLTRSPSASWQKLWHLNSSQQLFHEGPYVFPKL